MSDEAELVKDALWEDEHTCELLHLVERSINAERLVDELKMVFAVAGGPHVWASPENDFRQSTTNLDPGFQCIRAEPLDG